MISKATIKFIHSLEHKKYRVLEGAFVVEGHKSIHDMLCAGWEPRLIIATDDWTPPPTYRSEVNRATPPITSRSEVIRVTPAELQKASLLQHPAQALAVFSIPQATTPPVPSSSSLPSSPRATVPDGSPSGSSPLLLALDGIQDPGNLGTIIRTADWFGITDIICSRDTVDVYNPKVVQATMGSLARVRLHYTDLPAYLRSLKQGTPIYGTLLDGKDIYTEPLTPGGIIIMGNEGNGLSEEVKQLLTHKLLIPPCPSSPHQEPATVPSSSPATVPDGSPSGSTAPSRPESLNVSIATAITLSEFRRRVKKT